MQNESLSFENACLEAFHPIFVALLAYLLECSVIKGVWILKVQHERLSIKCRGDDFLWGHLLPNMIVVYKFCVIASKCFGFKGIEKYSLSVWELIPSLFPLFLGFGCDRYKLIYVCQVRVSPCFEKGAMCAHIEADL